MKAKEKTEASDIFVFDADAPQTINFDLTINRQTFFVAHILGPLADERFFEYAKANGKAFQDLKVVNLAVDRPKVDLWNDLALGRVGWKPAADWKAKTDDRDKAEVVDAYLFVDPISDAEDVLDADVLLDDDVEYLVECRVNYGGVSLDDWRQVIAGDAFPEWMTADEQARVAARVAMGRTATAVLTVGHKFRKETAAEMDEYLAALQNKPNPHLLASAIGKPKSPPERMAALYDATAIGATGYKGRVPVWHKTAAVMSHFARQYARAKKS